MTGRKRGAFLAALTTASLGLSGCISLGAGEPPESLLTLSLIDAARDDVGGTAADTSAQTLAIVTPEAPARLDVQRVPVAVSDTEIAYLKDAIWVEKPARLLRRLLGETIRTSGGGMLVLDGEDTPVKPTQTLRGTLLDMTYDPGMGEVVVRFDAIHTAATGEVRSRRFEARAAAALPEAGEVGPALNSAANRLAYDVAAWIAEAN